LETWRKEIESFAMEQGIPHLLDSSNLKENYLRNRIRLKLIPLLEKEYQPHVKKMVLKTSSLLRGEDDFIDQEAEHAQRRLVREEGDHLLFQFSEYQGLHSAVKWRFLRRLFEKALGSRITEGEKLPDIDQIYRRLSRPSASFHMELAHHLFLWKRYDTVLLGRGEGEPFSPFEIDLVSPGRTRIEGIGKEILVEEIPGKGRIEETMSSPVAALFDYEELQFPLRVRSFRPGDRFRPMGMAGTKKLKEFFIDQKIPRFERGRIPLLVSGERIIWIVGYRIDDRVRVTDRTKRILKVEVREIADCRF